MLQTPIQGNLQPRLERPGRVPLRGVIPEMIDYLASHLIIVVFRA